ncbi:Putative anti-sigma factor antagonist BtrV [Polystyrenella longa]|uniref:Anti-sigma factor antagonist BtrV n=1 Tax=Polystyrenella longa TaxID=2528007 RepID=A0A518CPZ1_9PLAN|nr:STAS domain-containing protein [Polystyrenella longa]QDU81293.1 Putative anti-sigma factor antagonist BtrV [Polystyrenella longa]
MNDPQATAFNVSHQDDITILSVKERFRSLDELHIYEMSTQLIDLARNMEPPLLVIDLSGVTYFGSSFLEILFRVWHQLRKREGELVLCSLQEHCEEVIRISNLDQLWKQFPDLLDAVEYLQSQYTE